MQRLKSYIISVYACVSYLSKGIIAGINLYLLGGISLKSLELVKWKEDGCEMAFRLVDMVSSQWREFGSRLSIEQDQLDSWEDEYRGRAARCWKKVMGHWLSVGGTHDYPATWEGLYVLLEDVEYCEVAKELKKAVAAAV